MPDVLVIEDAEIPRTDLVDYLSLKGFRTVGVGTGREARAALVAEMPAIVVLDIRLPDCNGFDLAREIRDRYDLACGIIMLTGLSSIEDRVEGMSSGADIYLVKNASLREIEANVRNLARRLSSPSAVSAPVPPAITAAASLSQPSVPPPPPSQPLPADWRLDPASWRLTAPNEATVQLTATEFACVSRLSECRGFPVSRNDLIAALDRPSMRYNDRNLDALISRIRRKIERTCGVKLPVSVVYGVGYVFRGEVFRCEAAAP